MPVRRKVVVSCNRCGTESVYDDLSDAQKAGWKTIMVKPIGASYDSEQRVTVDICPSNWLELQLHLPEGSDV